MPDLKTVDVTAEGDTGIRVRREFNAPARLVWNAFTTPGLVQRWLGIFGDWCWGGCEMDVRTGGRYSWTWKNAKDGGALVLSGAYIEVTPHTRIVMTQTYEGFTEFGRCVVAHDSAPAWCWTFSTARTTSPRSLSTGCRAGRGGAPPGCWPT